MNDIEDNNPTPSGIEDNDEFTDLVIDDEAEAAKRQEQEQAQTQEASSSSLSVNGKPNQVGIPPNTAKLYSHRVEDVLVNDPHARDTPVSIVEATRSNENDHPTTSRSYIIYTIKIADAIVVKRRYSEFENLRNVLVKLFPLMLVPAIPEKASITSNLALPQGTLKSTSSGNSAAKADADPLTDHVEYRKRALKKFLERCIKIDAIRQNFVFMTFLDPHPNFNEFIHADIVGVLNATSIYRLNPIEPISSLDDELYSSLPVPSDHLPTSTPLSDQYEKQFAEYTNYENRFKEYESILSNILKYNRNIIRSMSELSTDYTELGSYFNALSLEEESSSSHVLEKLGQNFDSNFFDINAWKNLINLKFLETILELKNYIKVVRSLTAYYRKKWLQSAEITKSLNQQNSHLQSLEKLQSQTKLIDDALSKSTVLNPKGKNAPASHQSVKEQTQDEEEQQLRAQISQFPEASAAGVIPSNKLFGYKIPGLKKVNKAIASMTDANPEQTRKQEVITTKLRIIQLNKQLALVNKDNTLIEKRVSQELAQFQEWCKLELNRLCYEYSKDMKEFLLKTNEGWQESTSALTLTPKPTASNQ